MADTTAQKAAEIWLTENFLPHKFPGKKFCERAITLTWGGVFRFDAVSEDASIICSISTSAGRTATGKIATAKIQKIKCDALYLLNTLGNPLLAMIFTEISMFDHISNEVQRGRFPNIIHLILANLPESIAHDVNINRKIASIETSPK